MPRGVYDRTKAKPRKSKNAKSKAFSKPGKARPVNLKPVNKKPVKTAPAPAPVKEMDVPAFLVKLKEATEALRACSGMTNHSKEGELLKNFAICLERQIEHKYKVQLEAE